MKKFKNQLIKKATALLLVASMGVLALGITTTTETNVTENSIQPFSCIQETQEGF